MKKLWIIRHAKSSWSDFSLSDHDRPLNKRGRRDAPFMAQKINESFPPMDSLISSTAMRAKTTCEFFGQAMNIPQEHVQMTQQLYHAASDDCIEVIHGINNSVNVAAIFGHNPTFTYLIHELTGEGPDNLPTCGCALIISDADQWDQFDVATCALTALIYPKQFLSND